MDHSNNHYLMDSNNDEHDVNHAKLYTASYRSAFTNCWIIINALQCAGIAWSHNRMKCCWLGHSWRSKIQYWHTICCRIGQLIFSSHLLSTYVSIGRKPLWLDSLVLSLFVILELILQLTHFFPNCHHLSSNSSWWSTSKAFPSTLYCDSCRLLP